MSEYKYHNRGKFFEDCCAKRWRKENKKTGISADDWWEQNKHRDISAERINKAKPILLIIILVFLVFTILNHCKF